MEQFIDFKLEIDRVGRRYRARVREAPAGRGAQTWVTLPARNTLEDLRTDLVRRGSGGGTRHLEIDTSPSESATNLGRRLFHSIFHDKVLESWHLSRAQAQSRLRLRLSLDNDPYLLSIPWELLFDPDPKDFVATVLPVVRSLDVPVDKPRPLAGPSPLRILTVLSCPADRAPLEIGQEWNALDGVLGGSVELRAVPPRLEEIDQALQAEDWHVLHFVGHGHADDKGGALILEDWEGGSRPVDHLRLGKFLGHPSIRLIVLNACDGGTPGRSDAFSGVAQALLRKGIPAVVAMQQPISDKAAIAFARELYGAIAKGIPLDGALVVARERLYRDFETTEWAIPVLYLNAANGEIVATGDPMSLSSVRPNPWPYFALIAAGVLLLSLMVWMSLRQLNSDERDPGPTPNPPRPPVSAAENPPECPSPPGLTVAFVKIEPGIFEMGDDGAERSRPVHQVTITSSFCIGVYEVTQEQWAFVLGLSQPRPEKLHLPISGVKYGEAKDFIRLLNEKDPTHPYRLPTEAEWEYVARGKTQMLHNFLADPAAFVRHANCGEVGDGFEGPARVGQFPANLWGVHDMLGNVSEWVSDWYGPYSDKPLEDPSGPLEGEKRIRRGGSWKSDAKACTSADRSAVSPRWRREETGFRIVREIR